MRTNIRTECSHVRCGVKCLRPKPQKKIYQLKRSPIKPKPRPTKSTAETLPEILELAQLIFNKWIRNRDIEKSCISCNAFNTDTQQAGHYFPVGSYSGVRFDEINNNGQCVECNCYNGGNQVFYEKGLFQRYSTEVVTALYDRAHTTKVKKWSREELQEIINKYSLKRKQ